MFTNIRFCDLIKKKSGIIKLEGEFMRERLFITPEYTTAKEIKQIRKGLHLTQKEFAEFINCSIIKNVAEISGVWAGSEGAGKSVAAQNMVYVWTECMHFDWCEWAGTKSENKELYG